MVSYATGSGSRPSSVTVRDLNDDGYLDIVVANKLAHNVSVFLGNGDGTFRAQLTFSTESDSYPTSVGIGDFDDDGQLDIAVVSVTVKRNGCVMLGNGDGTFGNPIPISSVINPSSFVIGDFDVDGQLDIAVVSALNSSNGRMLHGRGDGSFEVGMEFTTEYGGSPISVVTGDINGDGHLDVAIANYERFNVGVLLGCGNGSFAAQMSFWTGAYSYPKSVVIGDINGDGQLDLAVANYYAYNVMLLLGCGNGTFGAQTTFWTGYRSYPSSVIMSDLNGDSRSDLAIVNYGTDNIGVLLGNGDGTFKAQMTFSTGIGSHPSSFAVGDFNDDGQLDIAATNGNSDNLGILLNTC